MTFAEGDVVVEAASSDPRPHSAHVIRIGGDTPILVTSCGRRLKTSFTGRAPSGRERCKRCFPSAPRLAPRVRTW